MKEAIIAMWLASAADLGTTEYALRKHNAVELNPIQRNSAVRIVSHVVVPMFLTYEARKRPHDKRLKVLMWVAAGLWSAAATHNVTVMIQVGGG